MSHTRTSLLGSATVALALLTGAALAQTASPSLNPTNLGTGLLNQMGLVNVDLSNVLNNLAVNLNVDKSSIPVTIQLPVTVAANVCGVNVNVLSASANGGNSCQATTASPELSQVVQQQMAANGNVGGGAQGGSTAATGGAFGSGGNAAGGTTQGATPTAGTGGAATGTATTATAPTQMAPAGGATTGALGTSPASGQTTTGTTPLTAPNNSAGTPATAGSVAPASPAPR